MQVPFKSQQQHYWEYRDDNLGFWDENIAGFGDDAAHYEGTRNVLDYEQEIVAQIFSCFGCGRGIHKCNPSSPSSSS